MEQNNDERGFTYLSFLRSPAPEAEGALKQMFPGSAIPLSKEALDSIVKSHEQTRAFLGLSKARPTRLDLALKIRRCVDKKYPNVSRDRRDFVYRALMNGIVDSPKENRKNFEKHLAMWMQSSIVDPVEYFNMVPLNERLDRVFVEQRDGTYVSKDGWKIVTEGPDDEKSWVVYDPFGRFLCEEETLIKIEQKFPYTLYSYEDRYGRHGRTEMDIKFGVAHFPKGTVVEVDPAHPDHLGNNRFTVNHVITIGARNHLLVMDEIRPGVPGSAFVQDEPRMYNMHHVWKIIKRGDGPLDVREDFPEYQPVAVADLIRENEISISDMLKEFGAEPIKLRKGEHLFSSETRAVNALLHEIGRHPDHYGKWLNESAITSMAMRFGRFVSVYAPTSDTWVLIFAANVKKMRAWLKNNQHHVFMTARETAKLEDAIDRKQCEEMAFDAGEMDW